jgi:hypothetical protein
LIPWLFLTACQAQPTTALDTLIQIREACAAGDPTACRQLADASGASEMHTVHLAPDTRAEQVQKDVAAIIRGMQRSSASNGL